MSFFNFEICSLKEVLNESMNWTKISETVPSSKKLSEDVKRLK